MYYFQCDYTQGAHETVLEALCKTNQEAHVGYGEDPHCAKTKQLIRTLVGNEEAHVHFVTGGTQANLIVLSSLLLPYEGVLCPDTGHINVHETGAIEATGHKVLAMPNKDGKITAQQVEEACEVHDNDHDKEHVVKPGAVYISYPTEIGTLYSKTELEALSAVCKKYDLPLYIDGARLGYGMAADREITLPFLYGVADVFTIGGTKVGLLFGEAIITKHPRLQRNFRYSIKQKGALLAKGRLLGIQFQALLENDLMMSLCTRANQYAMDIKKAFVQKGIPLFCDTIANQLFVILTVEQMETLAKDYCFSLWGHLEDGRKAVRFCTSVTTPEEWVKALLQSIHNL